MNINYLFIKKENCALSKAKEYFILNYDVLFIRIVCPKAARKIKKKKFSTTILMEREILDSLK